MTLKALADGLNVSVMTVYRRCKANNIDIKDLRGEDGGLTSEGVTIIGQLFTTTTPSNTSTTTDATSAQPVINTEDNTVIIARLEATVDGLRALVDQLRGERDALRAALEREQRDRESERRLLVGSAGGDAGEDEQRRGFWRRFWRR